MNNTLYIKQIDDNTVVNILQRILVYTESYVHKNGRFPNFVQLSKRDYDMIKNYEFSVIDENKILNMEIILEEK